MDKEKAAADILAQALPMAAFEGWSQAVLNQAAIAAGYKKTDVIRVFPGGAADAIDAFTAQTDRQMVQALAGYTVDTMKIRERIATIVRLRLDILGPHREAVRKAIALQSMPFHYHHAVRNLYRTVDAMWYAAGDTSTDFNFYTKRLLLAAVYSSTLLVWLDDKSPNRQATWDFLERRIADVMKIEKTKHQLKSWFNRKTA